MEAIQAHMTQKEGESWIQLTAISDSTAEQEQ